MSLQRLEEPKPSFIFDFQFCYQAYKVARMNSLSEGGKGKPMARKDRYYCESFSAGEEFASPK